MLNASLIAAYNATNYVLFVGEGKAAEACEVVLNIGRPSAAFDAELARRGAETAVVVTAYNPRSEVLPDAENRLRHDQLKAVLDARGFPYAIGEGRDPTGHWQAEVECVVFGITVETGIALARAFDQNAIVFVRKGGAPELVYP